MSAEFSLEITVLSLDVFLDEKAEKEKEKRVISVVLGPLDRYGYLPVRFS